MTAPIPVAIVDDEPLARHKLRVFFEPLPDFTVVGEAGDGRSALRLIEAAQPQLLCLDIHLPGMSGLDVLRHAPVVPAVIFTTAHDRYAVSAFELAAVDYLLKPFSRERFHVALTRARTLLAPANGRSPAQRIEEVRSAAYLTHLYARDGTAIVPLRTGQVQHCEAHDDNVLVHAGGRTYRLHVTLTELEARLDPAVFVRVHRRFLVNLDYITAVVPVPGARLEARLRDGTALPVSRQRSRRLRARTL